MSTSTQAFIVYIGYIGYIPTEVKRRSLYIQSALSLWLAGFVSARKYASLDSSANYFSSGCIPVPTQAGDIYLSISPSSSIYLFFPFIKFSLFLSTSVNMLPPLVCTIVNSLFLGHSTSYLLAIYVLGLAAHLNQLTNHRNMSYDTIFTATIIKYFCHIVIYLLLKGKMYPDYTGGCFWCWKCDQAVNVLWKYQVLSMIMPAIAMLMIAMMNEIIICSLSTIHLSFFRHAFRIQKNVFDKGIDTETKVNTLNAW